MYKRISEGNLFLRGFMPDEVSLEQTVAFCDGFLLSLRADLMKE